MSTLQQIANATVKGEPGEPLRPTFTRNEARTTHGRNVADIVKASEAEFQRMDELLKQATELLRTL